MPPLSAVGISGLQAGEDVKDTDNTNETATAWYGDIVFGRLQGP